jgi:capsular polysaccharide biosynthesis protein
VKTGPFTFEGGVIDDDGQIRDEVHLRRRGREPIGGLPPGADFKPLRDLDEDILYLGWFHPRYGHFLLETLARSWFLLQSAPSLRVAFHVIRDFRYDGAIAKIFSAFGVASERIVELQGPTRVRRLIIPEAAYELGYAAHVDAARPFQTIARQILGDSRESTQQPVYLSRSKLPEKLRAIVGEDELERVLRDRGFHVAYPETLPFAEQVRLINRHAHVITNDGSAAYNLLFALGGPTVHYLTDGAQVPDYFLVPRLVDSCASFIDCLRPTALGPGRRDDLALDLAVVNDYLDRTFPGVEIRR